MVFIPKDLPGENHFDDGSRKAESVRPLCLGNCAAKIVTAAIVDPLMKLSEVLVDRDQFGMIKGRQITDNILELETEGLCASIRSGEGDAGVLLTDFSNAFPSLLHEWIFFVLEQDCPITLFLSSDSSTTMLRLKSFSMANYMS